MASPGTGTGSRLATVGRRVGRAGLRALGALPLGDRIERALLEAIWSTRSAAMLDTYLVSGYQNPRINVQSILLRHFLIRRLVGAAHEEVMDEELRFAIGLNEALRRRASELGVTMGSYLDPRKQAAVRRVDQAISGRQDQLASRWRSLLEGRPTEHRLRVLELACGSANDYRAFVDCGLAAYLDYVGVDITPKNIANARRRFPQVDFEVADARHLPFADRSFDYVIASDLFEHLSIDGMEAALGEAMRLARHGLALTFFNMSDAAEHHVERRRSYHWNRLSRPRIEALLAPSFGSRTVIRVAAWLDERYGYPHSYNRHAYSIFALRDDA